jgi:hypothetical protein
MEETILSCSFIVSSNQLVYSEYLLDIYQLLKEKQTIIRMNNSNHAILPLNDLKETFNIVIVNLHKPL